MRPLFVASVVAEAADVFELREGKLTPKSGMLHPRAPCSPLDVVTWLADLRAGPEGELLFEK